MADADGAPAARCRLYLAGPDPLPANFAGLLDIALATGDIACLRLSSHPDIGPLIAKAQSQGCAVLLDDGAGDVARFGADGVHLWQPEDYERARQTLGPTASIGVFCGNSRHAAMEAGEAGADYISLEGDLDLVRWWAEVMVVPVVVELARDLSRAGDFIAAGADFLCLDGGIWQSEESLKAAIAGVMALIA
jgi:thiamine-phosphate pyrophosphorylase